MEETLSSNSPNVPLSPDAKTLEQQLEESLEQNRLLEERLRFEQLLSEISSEYTNLPAGDVDETIVYGLQRLGKFFGGDRCNLAQFCEDDKDVDVIHSWADEGITPLPKYLEGTRDFFPWTLDSLFRGEVVAFNHPGELPPEAEPDRSNFANFDYKSQLAIPIAVGGEIVGALGMDMVRRHRSFSAETIQRLRRAGEIFANAIARKQQELEIQRALAKIEKLKDQLEAECSYLREEIEFASDFHKMIGQSASLKFVLMKINQIASLDVTVMITGETGTGKELVARAIHAASQRRERPMVKVNCAALPSNLIESELFGHEKGAFTSAQSRQAGRFELADGGTIFLDEIGELPLESQAKLLRVLQENEFERLGSSRTIKVDVRVIAATNRDLEMEVKKGRFRQDLWYRLNVFPIKVPPLQQRKDDIPLLVNWFVNKFSRKMGKTITRIPSEVMQALQSYHWPGNVRELENVIERAVISSPGSSLQLLDTLDVSLAAKAEAGLQLTLEEAERRHITQVLEDTRWRVDGPSGAALVLGMNPSTLRFRIRKLGIQRSYQAG